MFSTAYNMSSSPSGHAAVSVAAMVAIIRMAKVRAITVIAICIAVAVAVSRVLCTRHFLGDVIFGAYLGIFIPLYLETFAFSDGFVAKRSAQEVDKIYNN